MIRARLGYVVSYSKDSIFVTTNSEAARQFDTILEANNFREGSGELMYGWSIIEEANGQTVARNLSPSASLN